MQVCTLWLFFIHTLFNALVPGRNFDKFIPPNKYYGSTSWVLLVKLLSGEFHKQLWRKVHIGSGNGLVPTGNKPLPQWWLRSLSSYGTTRLQWVYATIIQRALPTQTPGAPWIKLSPACISNLMPSKVWDEITNPFPDFQWLHRWRFGMDK